MGLIKMRKRFQFRVYQKNSQPGMMGHSCILSDIGGRGKRTLGKVREP
jgi:hypothetical protein